MDQFSELTELLEQPTTLPLRFDLSSNTMKFVTLTAETLRTSAFHSEKYLRRSIQSEYVIRIQDLLATNFGFPRRQLTLHYIMHTAYCCSTLLARYFEAIRECTVFKEPEILSQLCQLRSWNAEAYIRMRDIVLPFLQRRIGGESCGIVKPNVPFNAACTDFMEYDLASKVIYLSVPLEDFLCSALKEEWRCTRIRFWLRSTASAGSGDVQPFGRKLEDLSFARIAAYWWMWNESNFERLHDLHPGRLIRIDGNELAAKPSRILMDLSEFLGIKTGEDLVGLQQRVSTKYSKGSSKDFGADDRFAELEMLKRRFAYEIDEAKEWIGENRSPM